MTGHYIYGEDYNKRVDRKELLYKKCNLLCAFIDKKFLYSKNEGEKALLYILENIKNEKFIWLKP
jgi:hypothetical protein